MRNKTRLVTFSLISLLVFTNETCEEKRRSKSMNSIFSGKCPLERIDWMKVSEGYDRNKLVALAASLEAAAKADASQIKEIAEGSAELKFKSSLKDSLQKDQEKGVEVSQAFYERYLNHRTVICALFEAAKDPQMRKNPEFVNKAMNTFIKINEDFAKIKEEEKKKLTP